MATDTDEKRAEPASPEKPATRKLKPFFYNLADLRDVSNAGTPFSGEIARHFANVGGVVKQILNIPSLRVVYYRFEPGLRLPYHNHGANQLTFILKGSLYYGGKRVTSEGMGFFTPAQDYAWIAGPEGAEILEIHDRGGHLETFFRDPIEQWPSLFFDWNQNPNRSPELKRK
jgi:quercetin dioxygenase-like cupin family protein